MVLPDFKKCNGLIPAIVQDWESGEVLMFAYMNEEAWNLTVSEKIAHYWSRSRKKLWKKGESSGNIQEVKEIRTDCDMDAVLIKVIQRGGAACHTGRKSCFYNLLEDGQFKIDGELIFNPEDVYGSK